MSGVSFARRVVDFLEENRRAFAGELERLKRHVYHLANQLENEAISDEDYQAQLVVNSDAQDVVEGVVKFVDRVLQALDDQVSRAVAEFEESLINQLDEVNAQITAWREREEFEPPSSFAGRLRELGTRQQELLKKIEVVQAAARLREIS
ncbi:MAG: hypothetical protein Kow0069_15450 [Promethearchaeota archaeon]